MKFQDKFEKLGKISLQMASLNISPSKADKFGIKIEKDGIFRSAEEILTQKDVDMTKIQDVFGPKFVIMVMRLMSK